MKRNPAMNKSSHRRFNAPMKMNPENSKNQHHTESPCRKVCRLDEDGMCVGCFRMLDEIANWQIMNSQERGDVVRKAHLRMQLRDLKL